MSPSQPESGSNDGLPTYVQMLVGFEAVPEWHNLLSTYFILQLTTGFITIPPAFVTLSTDGTSFRLTLNKPLYVQFHFTAFIPLDFIIRRFWFSKSPSFRHIFHSISVLMLTNHQVRERHLDDLRRPDRDVCTLPLSKSESNGFEEQPFLALPQILSARGRVWSLWADLIARDHFRIP